MPKRRRVDLSMRVQEAKDAAEALSEWMAWSRDAGERQTRVQRVLTRLQRGIAYVLDENPTNRPDRAKVRNV